MKIQTPDTRHSWFSKRSGRCKFFIAIMMLAGYSGFVFLTGGIAYQKGFFGKVLKPIIMENVRIPINYVRGLTSKPEHIILDIQHTDFQKLAYKREQALVAGVLHTTPEDFVPAKIRWRGKTIPVELRLKGDLGDHWADDTKWSFRIKTKGDRTVLGMKKFSLQHPRTRGFLNDWYLHQLLSYMGDFIVLRYDFIEFTLNGKNLGIYLMEEHFEEMLLKNNKHINAPIVRIYDHLLWYNVDQEVGFSRAHLNEHYTLSPIDAFNSGTISRDESLKREFNQAKNLFESFRQGKLSTHEVFDIDKLAQVCAVIDLLGYHHTTAYSNIRFYYDPLRSLLVPIGYDNTFIMPASSIHGQWKQLSGVPNTSLNLFNPEQDQLWYNTMFTDKIFYRTYIEALEKITNRQFLDDFFAKTDKDYHRELNLLYRTFPGYRFPYKETMYKNQDYIRNVIDPLQGIQAYFKSFNKTDNSITIELGNIQSLPVEIISLDVNTQNFSFVQDKVILQAKKQHRFIDFQDVEFHIPQEITWDDSLKRSLSVTYRILGTHQNKTVMAYPWSHLDDDFSKNDLLRKPANIQAFSFIDVNENSKDINIKPGTWTLGTDLIIPEGYTVHCTTGTTLILENNAAVISYSSLIFRGSQDSPITIRSSDKNPGQGIIVLHAQSQSLLSFIAFQRLSPPNRGDWSVSGGVTFYESPVNIDSCTFTDSTGYNSLSIIRSLFSISNSFVNGSQKNGIDVTYGNGKISNVQISDCRDNALNISGSISEVQDVFIQNIRGRALLCQDKSRVAINGMEIHGSLVGIETTDFSRVKADNIILADGKVGLAVYKEKRESGPAEMYLSGLSLQNIKQNYFVEKNSSLVIDGQPVNASKIKLQSFLSTLGE